MIFQRYSWIIIIVAVIVITGGFVFFNNVNKEKSNEEEIKLETITGTLVINNPGLGEGWHISYEEPGKPGLIKKITKTDETICFGNESKCIKFFKKEEDLAGVKVQISGILKNDEILLTQIEFY